MLLKDEKYLKNDRTAAAYFYQPDGSPVAIGTTLRNPALAEVLRQIASKGSSALLTGPVAQSIVASSRPGPCLQSWQAFHERFGGLSAQETRPLCADYSARGKAYLLCGPCRHPARVPLPSARFWAC